MGSGKRRASYATAVVLIVASSGAAPAAAAPACFGKPATIFRSDRRWLRGTNGDDVIVGSKSNFSVHGMGGDDLICQGGARFADVLDGGRGDDKIGDADKGRTWLTGGPGDDVLRSRLGHHVFGGPGDDRLRGGYILEGGPGDDELIQTSHYPAETSLLGGPGNDVIDSSIGVGNASYYGAPRGILVRLDTGSARGWGTDRLIAVETITGSGNDDILVGSDVVHSGKVGFGRSNDIFGGAGDDVIVGRGGADFLHGDDGVDEIRAGRGRDEARGGGFGGDDHGNDDIRGGAGDDELEGDNRAGDRWGDVLAGGRGNDDLRGGWGVDRLNGGRGDDDLGGFRGEDELAGGPGSDLIRLIDEFGSLSGGRGPYDTITFAQFGPVQADLRDQTALADGIALEFSGVEGLRGSYYGDELIGNDKKNFLFDGGNYRAHGEEDVLTALGGDDILAVTADPADDVVLEFFRAHGGEGDDSLTFAAARAGVTADLAAGTAAVAGSSGTVDGIEALFGSNHDDSLSGDEAANDLIGLGGDDLLYGRAGDDFLDGYAGHDVLDGGEGADECYGEEEASCEEGEAQEGAGAQRAAAVLLRRTKT